MSQKPEKPRGMGEPGRNSPFLTDRLIPMFADWLENEYGDIESLKEAWNEGFTGQIRVTNFLEAAATLKTYRVDEYGNRWGRMSKDFRRMRDAM